jgi:hypothetical protein
MGQDYRIGRGVLRGIMGGLCMHKRGQEGGYMTQGTGTMREANFGEFPFYDVRE